MPANVPRFLEGFIFKRENTIQALIVILAVIVISSSLFLVYASHDKGTKFGDLTPVFNDTNLATQEVTRGLPFATHMAFVDSDDILVLEKNNGTVSRVTDGTVSENLLDVNVANEIERGMLGIAVSENLDHMYVFLYFTEAESADGGEAIGNRLYRYELLDNKLVEGKLLLDLPASPGPYHNGGGLIIGPDGYVYLAVGDINGGCQEKVKFVGICRAQNTKAQNLNNASEPDGRAGILRLTQDGDPVGNGLLGEENRSSLYYAYGIRNSFGIDFDPVTSDLWDTEDGPNYADEINLVKPGFNSGWGQIQGMWAPNGTGQGNIVNNPDNLHDFDGNGKYSKPEFTWLNTIGISSIAFINSEKYGEGYKNDLLIGDVNNGNLYHFELNEKRTGLSLKGKLVDKVADSSEESKGVILGHDFGEITDLKMGPDGYIYALVYSKDFGKILKIVPDRD